VYNTLNILGLAFGLMVSLLIMFWIWDEMSFDNFHTNRSRIYRLVSGTPGGDQAWAGTPAQLAPELKESIPGIESFVRIDHKEAVIQFEDNIQNETGILLVDSNFFELFSYKLVTGNKNNVLRDINSIVLTESSAKKYFAEEDPINKIMLLNDIPYNISGVVEDPPYNSYHQFDFLIRFEKINENMSSYNYMECWGCFNFETYLLLGNNTNRYDLQSKIQNFYVEQDDEKREFKEMTLQPLKNIHFEVVRGNAQPEFPTLYIYLYSSLALIVLILAIINNINLTVAIAPLRSREVGLKKILGANRNGLISHFVFEAFIATLIAFVIALTLTSFSMPLLSYLTARPIAIDWLDPTLLLIFSCLILLISLASGMYPAIMLSRYSPEHVIKGIFYGKKKAHFRNILVTIQFVISISFIIGTLIFAKQMNYIRNKNLGYNKEQILNVRIFTNEIKDKSELEPFFSKIDALKNELRKLSFVRSASNNSFNPVTMNRRHGVAWEGMQDDEELSMFVLSGDKHMIPLLEMELLEGKDRVMNFERSGTDAYILNEAGLKALNWDTYDGKLFSIFGENRPGEVIGVVNNFHYRSLHHEIGPTVIILSEYGQQISLKIQTSDLQHSIEEVNQVYAKIFPKSPFEFYFLDQEFDKLYKSEIRMSRAVSYLTFISIIIACMGIFGLSSYMAVQRTKEIGIRKVMGSTVSQIIYILTYEVVKWVALAFIIAAPLTYYFISRWLDNFAYKTSLPWWIFILSAVIVMFIALTTVMFQAVKAAVKNPTEALRYE
jgi:putative ABC transport system permease protein